jgi:hypothetical protein
VTVKMGVKLRARIRLAILLIRAAGWALGLGVEVDNEKQHGGAGGRMGGESEA